MFICTSDGGSDEVQARRSIHAMFDRDLRAWIYDNDCFQHSYHLMVFEGLKQCDDFLSSKVGFKHLNNLTKLLHLWRERAVSIHAKWKDMFGLVSAQHAAKVPPQCITGRWGAVSRCENYVIATNTSELRAVFEELFVAPNKKKPRKK